MICRASAAATLCESLAASLPDAFPPHVPRERYLAEIAAAIEAVPLVHPLRAAPLPWPESAGETVQVAWDAVLDMARAVRRETATAEGLRAFAAALRAGLPEMRATGWGWAIGGVE